MKNKKIVSRKTVIMKIVKGNIMSKELTSEEKTIISLLCEKILHDLKHVTNEDNFKENLRSIKNKMA